MAWCMIAHRSSHCWIKISSRLISNSLLNWTFFLASLSPITNLYWLFQLWVWISFFRNTRWSNAAFSIPMSFHKRVFTFQGVGYLHKRMSVIDKQYNKLIIFCSVSLIQLYSLKNRSISYHRISCIKHNNLSGCDCSLGLFEIYFNGVFSNKVNSTVLIFLSVPYFGM